MPKANKPSFKNDDSRSKVVIARFGKKSFRDITPEMIEKFKCDLAGSTTRRGTTRSQADVNRHLEFLSAVFELAIQYRRVSLNPCRQVKRFRPENERHRYLFPEEEGRLLAAMTGRLKHLRTLATVSLEDRCEPHQRKKKSRDSDERKSVRCLMESLSRKGNERLRIPKSTNRETLHRH